MAPPKDVYMTHLAQVDAITGNPPYDQVYWKLASPEDISKMGGRTLYAVGCVYYKGLDRTHYYSDVCTKWAGNSFQPCDSRDRNHLK